MKMNGGSFLIGGLMGLFIGLYIGMKKRTDTYISWAKAGMWLAAFVLLWAFTLGIATLTNHLVHIL